MLFYSIIFLACTTLVFQQLLLRVYHIGLSEWFSDINSLYLHKIVTISDHQLSLVSDHKEPLIIQSQSADGTGVRIYSSSTNPGVGQYISFGSSSFNDAKTSLISNSDGDLTIYTNRNMLLNAGAGQLLLPSSSIIVGNSQPSLLPNHLSSSLYVNGSSYLGTSVSHTHTITGRVQVAGTLAPAVLDVTNTTMLFNERTARHQITNFTIANLKIQNILFESMYVNILSAATIVGVNMTQAGGLTVTNGFTVLSSGMKLSGGISVIDGGLSLSSGGVTVGSGGLKVNQNGFTVLSGGSSLGGTLFVSGAVSVNSGGLKVSAGGLSIIGGAILDTLNVNGGTTVGSGGLNIGGGGALLSEASRLRTRE